MLHKLLRKSTLVLASKSPRRHQLLKELGLDFDVRIKSIDESYPNNLKGAAIAEYIAEKKAAVFEGDIAESEIILTSDTVVWKDNVSLAKPKDAEEAKSMLMSLSGNNHEVITAVCLKSATKSKLFHSTTKVFFKELTEEEIDYYITNYKPFDKAGAYGIQEWIGFIGITKIEGSYFNVVGLPVQEVYTELIDFIST